MNEIIQSLECNAPNGKENFCYISKKRLEAIKKLSTIEDNEFKKLNKGIDELIKKYEDMVKLFDGDSYIQTIPIEMLEDLEKLKGE